MKMPQLNSKYPSRKWSSKKKKKEERIKADEKRKGLLDRFVVVVQYMVLMSLQRRVQLQAPKLLIVVMSV